MRPTKANIAGLTSPLQQAEMKSILAGRWPPLQPLPVFKYETVEYRATIAFDKKCGEWVCRKTSLPSNTVQELRGGLREITLALPHDEDEVFTEEAEPQVQELEKDMNRRLQAIHDWRENYESGALYFKLRDYLTESQQTEVDDSLRLSMTARQLQFNPKNVAYVFDALSTAGGRFATLIECAMRKRAMQGTEPQVQRQGATCEAERTIGHDEQPLANSSCEFKNLADNQIGRYQEAAERCSDTEQLPALSIKNVLPEQEQSSLGERIAPHRASQQLQSESSEIVETDSASLFEHRYQEERCLPALTGLVAHGQTGEASAERSENSSRFPVLEISAFQVAVFAALFLSAVFAFIVGLTLGRGPFAHRFPGAPNLILTTDAMSPTLPGANEAGNLDRFGEATPREGKSRENTPDTEDLTRSMGANLPEPVLSAKDEVSLAHGGAIEPGALAAGRLGRTRRATPGLLRTFTILVTRPGHGSQPFWVSFPERTIAATSSLAMSSQLFVLVSAETGLGVDHNAARLEAGDLVSFVWPRYARPGNGLAETIRVRITIGQLGQVREVKFLSGSSSLLPATKAAVLQWRYRPTLLDKRPVQAQQEVTIAFRPPQYSTQVSTQRSSHR